MFLFTIKYEVLKIMFKNGLKIKKILNILLYKIDL